MTTQCLPPERVSALGIKLLLLGIGFGVLLSARVSIKPATPVVVAAGTALRFKANTAVRWSLAAGSVGTIDPDGTYHAPASIHVNNSMAGCQILPNDHVFNTRIDSLPVHPKSKTWMSQIPVTPLYYDPSFGINIADAQTPKHSMHFFYGPQNDGVYELVQWPFLKRESGVFSAALSDVDRHVLTVDRDSCNVFELYNNYDPGTNTQCPSCTAQGGVRYSSLSSALPHGATDAAGLLLAPLTLHLEEVRSGAIRHALRVTLQNSKISPSLVWPATANAGAWGMIPYGTRFRLKRDFDISRFSPLAKVLLTQLKEYGVLLADGGANWEVDVSTDVTEDAAVLSAFGEVSGSQVSSSMEIVDESALMSSAASGEVKPENGYVKPDSYAEVIATDLKNPSSSARARITLQGVTIGFPNPAIWIQSGVTQKLVAWVNGTADKGLRWSMSPRLGTLASDGVYSAPTVKRPTTIEVTATSTADTSSSAHVAVTILPAGPIRIKVGNATGAPGAPNRFAPDYGPDSSGNMWWREQAGEFSAGAVEDGWYGGGWPSIRDIPLYYTSRYSQGDMVYRFSVPNGRYKITLLFARTACPAGTTYDTKLVVPIKLEAQGEIIAQNYDWGSSIRHLCRTPASVQIPAEVTKQDLYFALRRVTSRGLAPDPVLNGFLIEPDNSGPHLAIDPSYPTKLTIGNRVQLNAVGWYMGNAVSWSIVKGPGSITRTGLYTAPSVPPATNQEIVVEAKSTVDPAKNAIAKMEFEFGSLQVSPSSTTIARSLSQQMEATLDGTKYSNVTWSVAPPVGTINSSGLYTAPNTLSRDTQITVKAQSRDDTNKTSTAAILVKAVPDPIRIICGDSAFRDAHGNLWSSDYNYSGGTATYQNRVPIAGASPDMQKLYQSSRYRYANESFSYIFPLPPGRYSVTLKFADYTYDTPGHYSFDVRLNGKAVLTNFDPDTVHGTKTAVDKEFETTVTNKQLKIDFFSHVGAAFINGIQILYLGPA